MKKLMSIIVSILFALSMTGLAFAQAPAPKAAEPEKKVEEKKAPEKKAKKAKKAEKKAKKAKKAEKKAEEAPAPEKAK
jgi:Ni/Co efflux regulator RcnB